MAGYDSIDRRFFSHPEMVLDLLHRFVGGEWVRQLDTDCLEQLPAHYVSEELEHREQDLVWRVKIDGDRRFYVYLLLEFQSTVDRFMALRLLVYLGLLYQDLVKQGDLTPDRLLPPVLPLVLYNGDAPWWAPVEISDLIGGSIPELSGFQPRFRYQVLDEVHLPQDLLEIGDSPVAGMIRVERSENPGELRTSLRALLEALDRAGLAKLAPDVETWLRRVVRPKRFRGLDLGSWPELKEVTTMLEERVKRWEAELLAQGAAQGRSEGVAQGVAQGMVQGRAEGLRAALRKQFRLKYRCELTRPQEVRVAAARPETLELLLERILTAATPGELFSAD